MRVLVLALVLAATATEVDAQAVLWARSVGMGGSDFALARGFAAVETNPANLFIEDSIGFSMGTSLHGGRVLVTGADLFDLADIVTSAGAGSSTLLDNVPAEGLRIDAVSEGLTANTLAGMLDIPDPSGNAEVPTFGLTYRGGGLVIRNHTVVSALVSRELVDLAVNGFNPEQINEYAAKNTHIRSFTLMTITGGLSKRFGRLSTGFGIRYVYGRKLMNGLVFEPEIDVDRELLSASAASIESRGANGFGVDVGVSLVPWRGLYASVAIQNLWQRLHWSNDPFVAQSTFDQDDIGATDMRELIGRFTADDFDPDATTLEAYAASANLFEEAFLPRMVTAGLGWRPRGGTELQVTASTPWGAGGLTAPRTERVAAGLEQALGVLRLRSGIAWERDGSREIAGGFGLYLSALRFDFAGGWTVGTGDSRGLVHGLSGSFGVSFVFMEG